MPTETTNALGGASSAYLRSAMHQPIHWNEWGEAAFEQARRENKPMLLDIGAVWCHWCHVMDRESYDNPEIAEIINQHFVAVKVDRDERPDIDSRYQAGVQAISGQGGWPLTAFLTPEGKPFFGGTYFPPESVWGRPGFKQVLQSIAQAYREKHGEVVESANSVMAAIEHGEAFAGRSGNFSPRVIDTIMESAKSMFDAEHGGFGTAPKFPHPASMDVLCHRYAASGDAQLKAVIATTLGKMARGGVYDQLAGGFHRYSVDERWVVPHFEKMSYDNSELLKNYVHGYQATGEAFFAHVARDIIRWMDAVLSDREQGGFYASQDADLSMDDDGDYFTWTLAEAKAVLTPEEAEAAALYYDIGETGEMHHDHARNVLFVKAEPAEIAVRLGMKPDRAQALVDGARKKMLSAREKRPTPYIDKTVYVNWNALAISAYLEGARVLALDEARKFALRSLDRLLAEGWDPKRGLKHVIAYSDPSAARREVPGLLDDHAFLVIACLDAYEATSDLSYFNFARRIAEAMIERFHDGSGGGFFDTEKSAAETALGALGARRKPFQDAPTPAGDPAAALALLRLFSYTGEQKYREMAQETLEVVAGVIGQFGIFAGTYGVAAMWLAKPHIQAVIMGTGEQADQLAATAIAPLALNKTVLRLKENEVIPQNLPPALAETLPRLPGIQGGKAVAVLCTGFACRPPISDCGELAKALREAIAAGA